MALSSDVVSQFAKAMTPKEESKEVTVNATYKMIGDKEYVLIDGSDILTPVNSTVVAETDDRVKVLIKEHSATIVGNITSPSARNKDLNTLKDEVDEYGNVIKRMDTSIQQQETSIIQLDTAINQHEVVLNQHNTVINQHGDMISSIDNTVIAQGNAIEANNNSIIAQGNQIDSMNNTITQHNDSIISMNNTIVQQGNRITQNSNTINQQGNTINQQGNIITQQGNHITEIDNTVEAQGNVIVAQGNVIESQGTTLQTHNSQITILNTGFVIQDGVLTGLSAAVLDDLETNTLDVNYAQIDFANIQMAAVEKLFTESGMINDLTVDTGAVTGELVGVTLKGDLIEANTLIADKLVIRGLDGLYYKLNTTGETIESEQTSINSLNGQVIAARSITASKIQVTDLVAFGATIGGFDISQHSINSHLKTSVDSSFDGIYLSDDGQMAIGNDRNHIKYYKDQNDNYILDVRLDKLYLGASNQTAEQQMQGMVEISADNITSTFRSTGGSNLIRNSVGYSGTDFWIKTVTSGGYINTYNDDNMSVSGSEFIIKNAILEQVYNTQVGSQYSVAFKYKHTIDGSANRIKVELVGNGITKTILDTTEAATSWTSVVIDEPYIATIQNPKLVITNSGTDIFEITDLIISQGTNDVWSGYKDEIYGKVNQLDANGLRLYNSNDMNKYSNTTSTAYQIRDVVNGVDTEVAELSRDKVHTKNAIFESSMTIKRLHTMAIDDYNVIEYISEEVV